MISTEQSYRREWATLTGKSESEIYVPEAIRENRPLAVGDRVRILIDLFHSANVRKGQVLTVSRVSGNVLTADGWYFQLDAEGRGWERV